MSVVAAAIVGPDGRLLLYKRPEGKRHAGLWEFPGGKVEPQEIPASALVREIEEELDILLDPAALEPACFAENPAGEGEAAIVILLYIARSWEGDPHAREGGEWGWFRPEEAALLPKPPLDVALLEKLRLFAE